MCRMFTVKCNQGPVVQNFRLLERFGIAQLLYRQGDKTRIFATIATPWGSNWPLTMIVAAGQSCIAAWFRNPRAGKVDGPNRSS